MNLSANQLQIDSDAQSSDVRALESEERDKLIISLAQVDNQWLVLSRYGDDKWQLIGENTNTSQASVTLNFSTLPPAFRKISKEINYRYLRRGILGGPRPKAVSVVRQFMYAISFFRHLERLNIMKLADVSPFTCSSYVQACKEYRQELKGRKPLSPRGLVQRYLAVEMLYKLSQYTADAIPTHPWPDTSASHMAGSGGNVGATLEFSKTPIIPDEIFSPLYQHAWSLVEQGDEILNLRDQLAEIEAKRTGQHFATIIGMKNSHLDRYGWVGGVNEFNETLLNLRTAAYIVVASVSGCRNHELAFIQSDACYSTEDEDKTVYWWMRSQSTKTLAGHTEWMVPEAAVTALKVMDRWAKPLQKAIAEEISHRRSVNPLDPEITQAQRHLNAVFLGVIREGKNRVRTLSSRAWGHRFKVFLRKYGITWKLSSHQFRRTFANYAARSKFGDLRYLREHFKHWTTDTTLGYALNENQDIALYAEIEDELNEIKEGIVELWARPTEPLAGGYGANIVAWRNGEAVTLFKNRKHMVKAIAESTAIRSNGHAWCTADDTFCVGNDLEPTRCSTCTNGVIGREHGHLYQGQYLHLKELLGVSDIGEAGRVRVRRDLERCRSVLASLGYVLEEVEDEGTA